MNRIEEKAHTNAHGIPQMEIRSNEPLPHSQQKSGCITTHNGSQLPHQKSPTKSPSIYHLLFIIYLVATGRIELPLPNHRSGVAFGGFPTGLDTGSRPVCYPTRVATHGDATGRLFYVQTGKEVLPAGRRNKLKKISFEITDKIIKYYTYWNLNWEYKSSAICLQKKWTIKFVMKNSRKGLWINFEKID